MRHFEPFFGRFSFIYQKIKIQKKSSQTPLYKITPPTIYIIEQKPSIFLLKTQKRETILLYFI